jgi:hypothetical protein
MTVTVPATGSNETNSVVPVNALLEALFLARTG